MGLLGNEPIGARVEHVRPEPPECRTAGPATTPRLVAYTKQNALAHCHAPVAGNALAQFRTARHSVMTRWAGNNKVRISRAAQWASGGQEA